MIPEHFNSLFDVAVQARDQAYAPYSDLKIGSAVLGNNGEIYTGCNIENSSFGATICAERVAIFKAISDGATSISAIVLVTDHKSPIAPCGMCRQVLSEFAKNDHLPIYLTNLQKKMSLTTLGELLPHSFSKKTMLAIKNS